jgi:hypothetical protein
MTANCVEYSKLYAFSTDFFCVNLQSNLTLIEHVYKYARLNSY